MNDLANFGASYTDEELQELAARVARNPKEDSEAMPAPTLFTTLELMERTMPAIEKLCDPWATEGLHLIAGRPKLGKTTVLRQKLAAIAGGDEFFGAPCTQATVLFLCLEEGERLARKKFEMAGFSDAALAHILMQTTWRRGKDGILDLHRSLDQNPQIKHVGIDSLTRFRDIPDARKPAFSCDYEAVTELHTVAKSRPGLGIDVIHHTRKQKSDDPIEDISGTFGISAGIDSYWVMRHHEDGAILHVGGRLWESSTTQFQLRRANQRWELVGEFTGGQTYTQAQTLAALRKSPAGLTPTQAAALFGMTPQAAFERLGVLVRNGLARNEGGCYFAGNVYTNPLPT